MSSSVVVRNIYPVQIEDFLRTNDAILDVAVIGLADHRLGEISAAIIELKPGVECHRRRYSGIL